MVFCFVKVLCVFVVGGCGCVDVFGDWGGVDEVYCVDVFVGE